MSDCFTSRSHCRLCGSDLLTSILDLGVPVLSDFVAPSAPNPPQVPLDLLTCERCGLVQLRDTTDPALLYTKYWYRSGVNEVMQAELADVVQKAVLLIGGLQRNDTVMDIGANDGTLLANYAGGMSKPFRVAYEPARNLYDQLRPHADCLVPSCFPNDFDSVAECKGDVRILTSIAMFNHVDDPQLFVEAVDKLLAPDGVWVMQVQDLAGQIKTTAYDNVCHEHVTYYSLATFERLLRPYDLALSLVEPRSINGGSLRFYVRRRKYREFTERVDHLRAQEAWLTREALARFAWRVDKHKAQLVETLDFFQLQGAPCDLYAASTKSSTLLQHCGIDRRRIRCAVERTPEKWGLETSGTRIPIVSEATWRQDPAPICLIGAWQFKDAFVAREAEYLAAGGRFLVPLPATELIEQRAVAV